MSKGTVCFKDGTEEEIYFFRKYPNNDIRFTCGSGFYIYKQNEPEGKRFYRLVSSNPEAYLPADIKLICISEVYS